MKTEVFNLIILDESGSMGCMHRQTINGCNETIDTIKNAQNLYAETQDHYVSIFCFSSMGEYPSRYLVKNIPANCANHIGAEDYMPGGGTPLFDAVGSTLVDLKACTREKERAIGSVTIITDGEENSSRKYSLEKVATMISELKEMGWNFNFIGANIDVVRYSSALNIDNRMTFMQSEEGTRDMFEKERRSRMSYATRIDKVMHDVECCPDAEMDKEKLKQLYRDASKDYFA